MPGRKPRPIPPPRDEVYTHVVYILKRKGMAEAVWTRRRYRAVYGI